MGNETIVCANQLPPTVSTIGRLGDTGELRRDDWHNAVCTKDSNNKQGTADSFHEALGNSTSKEITHELVPYSNHSSVAVLDFLNILIDHSQPGEGDGEPSENWPCVYSEDLVQQALKTNTEIVLDPVEKDNNMTAWALQQLGRKSQSGTLRILMNQLIYKRRWQIMLRPEKLEWKRKRNILRLQDRYGPESIYGSIIGYVVRREHWCEGCKLQKGPFAYCIIVLGHMGSGCTNCHYQAGSTPCSFYGVLRQMTLQDQAAFEANSAPQSISGAVHRERHDDIPISSDVNARLEELNYSIDASEKYYYEWNKYEQERRTFRQQLKHPQQKQVSIEERSRRDDEWNEHLVRQIRTQAGLLRSQSDLLNSVVRYQGEQKKLIERLDARVKFLSQKECAQPAMGK